MELKAEEFEERENLGKFLARKIAQDRVANFLTIASVPIASIVGE
jgi:hypothetical protein